jgi:hypothetical protein
MHKKDAINMALQNMSGKLKGRDRSKSKVHSEKLQCKHRKWSRGIFLRMRNLSARWFLVFSLMLLSLYSWKRDTVLVQGVR